MAPIQNKSSDREINSERDREVVVEENGEQKTWTEVQEEVEEKAFDIDTLPVWDKIYDQVEDLNVRVARHVEDANDNAGWQSPMVKSPPQPIRQEWLQHQLTHTPYAQWCTHCNSARVVRKAHQRADKRIKLVPDIDNSTEGSVKVRMDYMYLHERLGKHAESRHNPLYLVMVEHRHGRVWTYHVPNKGSHEDVSWLPTRIIQDWETCGYRDMRVQLKIDQEFAVVSLQHVIQSIRPKDVITVNSTVGESESNGRVENVVRRTQEKTRALRHQVRRT